MPDQRTLTIIAQDPSVRVRGRILRARVSVPAEVLGPGPRGARVRVIDYDATTHSLYQPDLEVTSDRFHAATDRQLLDDPHFHAQNVYAIVMRTLTRFERALGRPVEWGFKSHQIRIAPHAFRDPNAFYSKHAEALLFGYFPSSRKRSMVFSCLSHNVVAHETAHALLDGLRGGYLGTGGPDQAAFHEGFADLVAILSVFSLPEVLDVALPRSAQSTRPKNRWNLRECLLLRIAQQLGREVHGHQAALRHPARIRPSQELLLRAEYQEPHRRGEVLVSAILRAFIDVWEKRIGGWNRGKSIRKKIVEEGAHAADYLLSAIIRALDYCPPTDLSFSDFLSALLTADFELSGQAMRGFRDSLRSGFAAFGIAPESTAVRNGESGLWPKASAEIALSGSVESLHRNQQELFRVIWNHRRDLDLCEEASTKVESAHPCTRLDDRGFSMRETVAEYVQTLRVRAGELSWMTPAILKPAGMPNQQMVTLTGGGTLIFDQRGHLKYDIRSGIRDTVRQSRRLAHQWSHSCFDEAPEKS